jgi:hypothetical protein
MNAPAACTDYDACSDATVDCGTGASCVDAMAPATGYQCECDPGYAGASAPNAAATCKPLVTVTQAIYKAGTLGNSVDEAITGTIIDLVPNTEYQVTVEILRDDLGDPSEYVKSINVAGTGMGSCYPDGGDYDCTFFQCPQTASITSNSAGQAPVNMVFTGHSWDCDCDTSSWTCAAENTVKGWTPMKAVARFTLVPSPTS